MGARLRGARRRRRVDWLLGGWTPADALGYSKMLALTGIFHKRAGQSAAAGTLTPVEPS